MEAMPQVRIRAALNGLDPAAVRLHGQDQTTAHGLVIQHDGTGPAGALFAAHMAAGEAQIVA